MQELAVDVFIMRLSAHSRLTAEEIAGLRALPWQARSIGSRHDLTRIGEVTKHCYIVADGLVGRFQQVTDGRRQFLSIHFAGDMVNLQAMMVPDTMAGVNALTASRVEQVSVESLCELSERFPSIGQALWREFAIMEQILAQSLIGVGRRSARARIAHFLCEVGERIHRTQGTYRCEYHLPMSQEQIADTLGMTSVHLNRMFAVLRAEQLISTQGHYITINDFAKLAWVGEFDPSYLDASRLADRHANRAVSS